MTQQAEVTKEIILKKVVVSRVTLQETPNGLIDSTRVLGATCLRETEKKKEKIYMYIYIYINTYIYTYIYTHINDKKWY